MPRLNFPSVMSSSGEADDTRPHRIVALNPDYPTGQSNCLIGARPIARRIVNRH